MTQTYYKTYGDKAEMIKVLTQISIVSARMARNLQMLDQIGKSMKGVNENE